MVGKSLGACVHHLCMRLALPLAFLALAAPLALAGHYTEEPYVGSTLGPASWATACLQELNLGAVCFPLEGHERRALILPWDQTFGGVGSRFAALDADLLPLAMGDACYQEVSIPAGASYLAVMLVPLLHVIPECQPPPTAGVVRVEFG